MDGRLMIESEEACRLANDLARITGEDLGTAVENALRERIARERKIREKIADVRKLTAEIRAHLRGPVSSDHSWLYDEDGLPK